MSFTMIRWAALENLDVSVSEYILLDTIHGFSLKTGWCYASRAELGRRVRMTRRWVQGTLESLGRRGLVEYQAETRHLRCTGRWTQALAAAAAGGERTAPVKNLHPGAPVKKRRPVGENPSPEVVKEMHPAGEMFAPKYNREKDNGTGQEQDSREQGTHVPEGQGDGAPAAAAAPCPEPAVAAPPPVAAAPVPARQGLKPPPEPCLTACRAVYLRHFPDYGWRHGRDDKLLEGVLAQIRGKIALRQAGEAPGEYVLHSFEGLLRKIPDWYRRNGHTTPGDLDRHFEKHYAAIRAGQGGGGPPHLAPATDRDREYLHLMQVFDET